MIAIGIDAVDIKRFGHWHTYKTQLLSRIFSPTEIAYCLSIPQKSAERFAVRFAAKEAFFKALYQMSPGQVPPFLKVARHAHVTTSTGNPTLAIDWKALNVLPVTALVTLTHTKTIALAQVLIVG